MIAIGRAELAAPLEETTDDLHAEIALVDRSIADLSTYRAELVREITRRQLERLETVQVAKASERWRNGESAEPRVVGARPGASPLCPRNGGKQNRRK